MPFTVFVALLAVAAQNGQRSAVIHEALELTPRLSLGAPVQIGDVGLVPIESTVPIARDKYLTLAEATKLGVVEIVELPGGQEVNALQVQNTGSLPILMFAGELLLGGKQDRIVAKDSIVPPHDRREVQVFCVEHGRWEGKTQFRFGNTLVPEAVRSVAVNEQDQIHVWSRVATTNAKAAAAPATGTVRGTIFNADIQASADRLVAQMNARFRADAHTVGVICWIGGRIQSADLFANAELFKASRAELFRSYAIDAHLAGSPRSTPVDLRASNGFLSAIVSGRRSGEAGGRYQIANPQVRGVEFGRPSFAPHAIGNPPGGPSGGGMGGGFSHGTYRPGTPPPATPPTGGGQNP